MKEVQFSYAEFKKAIKQLHSIVKGNSNTLIDTLRGAIMDISQGNATFTVSDLETTLTVTIPCTSMDAFKVCIPVKEFDELLSTIANAPVNVRFDEALMLLSVSTASGNIKFGAIAGEFPTLPATSDKYSFTITDKNIDCMRKATNFVSKDTLRPAMTGVMFDIIEGSQMKIVSTDAHRMYCSDKIDINYPATEISQLIIPASAIDKLLSSTLPDSVNVSICTTTKGVEATHISFTTPSFTYTIRLIDAKFPNYMAIIPEYKAFFQVKKNDLVTALNFTKLCSSTSTHETRFDIQGTEVKINSSNIDEAKEATSQVPIISKNCIDFLFALNCKLVLEALQILGDEITVKNCENPTRAIIMSSEESNDIVLMMPLMISK